jgi:hypothetical protein
VSRDHEAEKPSPAPQEEDRIEVLGRRIARLLGWLLAAALLVYLYATYLT